MRRCKKERKPLNPDSAAIGAEVRRRRTELKLTVEKLAELANLSTNYLGSIELGTRDPSLSTIISVARGLGVHVQDLLPGKVELSPASVEAGKIFSEAPPEVQKGVLAVLRHCARYMRRS